MGIRFFLGRVFRWLGKKEFLNFLSDELYLKVFYYLFMEKDGNFSNPKTLNQKINWLKLNNRRKEYIDMVDKHNAKEYVANVIGREYIIPTLGVWDKFDDIDFDSLPREFVLKCTHDSGSAVVCKDKNKISKETVKNKLNRCLKRNYFWMGREWVYKNIKPRIIAEQYMEDKETKDLRDYKFYCFGDYVDSVLVCVGRESDNTKFYFFDRDWNLKRYNKRGNEAPVGFTLPMPKNMDKMFEIAKKLSVASGAPFLRVDLYNVDGKIYFGELTFYPDCGMDRNRLYETDEYFGSLVDLSMVHKLN